MPISQSQFQNAHDFQVNNGHFINNIIINNENDAVSTVLWPRVADGAIFDSAARYAAGKCHPGTRKKIIEKMFAWIDGEIQPENILWAYGPAGAGKSALAHTLCELLKLSRPERYGGSFFFSAGSTDRGNAHRLFTTLSYQLAIHFPHHIMLEMCTYSAYGITTASLAPTTPYRGMPFSRRTLWARSRYYLSLSHGGETLGDTSRRSRQRHFHTWTTVTPHRERVAVHALAPNLSWMVQIMLKPLVFDAH